MGLGITCSVPSWPLEQTLAALPHDARAGTVAATAMRAGLDKFVRKDTGQLAGSALVSPWEVTYPKRYAAVVWDVPPQIVSPRNPLAVANPHLRPEVAERVAEQVTRYRERLR